MIEKFLNKLLLIIIFIVPLTIYPNYTTKLQVLYFVGILLFTLLLVKFREWTFDKSDLILLGFLILVCISTIFSVNVKVSIFGYFNRYEGLLTFIIYYLVYYCSKYYFRNKKSIIIGICILTMITSILAILQYYNAPFIKVFFKHASFACATFGNRNFYGAFISLTFPIIMCLYIFLGKKLLLIPNALLFYSMLACLTRSCYLAFIVFSIIGVIYLIKQKNKNYFKRSLLLLILFVLLFILFNVLSPNALIGRYKASIEEIQNKDSLGSNRGYIWQIAINTIKDHPLTGCGTDAFLCELTNNHTFELVNVIYDKVGGLPDKAHNEYLQIASTIGIPALILYLAFVALTIKNLLRNDLNKNKIAFVVLLCIISYLVQAFFNISTIDIAPILYLIYGYSYQLREYKKLPSAKKERV